MSGPSLGRLALKEARALLPTWFAAAVAMIVAELAFGRLGDLLYILGALALGAQIVGHEYGHRTIAVLLVQPIDRRRIYVVKLIVAAVLLAGLALVARLALGQVSWQASLPEWPRTLLIVLPPLGALLFGPWMTMLCRSPLAGTLFSTVPAGVVFVSAQWLAYRLYEHDDAAASLLIRQIWFTAMAVMAPTAAVLGWREFVGLEAIDGGGRAIELPRLGARLRPRRPRHHLWQSIAKEIHLQQMTLVTVALFVAGVLWGLVQVARGVIAMDVITVITTIYLAGTALLIGALASAEERQLGTHELDLMLPTPAWQRWLIKVTVATTLAVLVAAALPAVLLSFAPDAVNTRMFLPGAIVPVLLITAAGMYVSSLSTSGVSAMAAAFPAIAVAYYLADRVDTVVSDFTAEPFITTALTSAAGQAFLGVLVALLLWLGFLNHRSLERGPGRIVPQVAVVLVVIVLGAAVS